MGKKLYSEEQREFLKTNSMLMTRKELTKAFNRTFDTDKTVSTIRGYCKSNGWRSSSDGRFIKNPNTVERVYKFHHYTKDQDDYILNNFRQDQKFADKYNEKFGTDKQH